MDDGGDMSEYGQEGRRICMTGGRDFCDRQMVIHAFRRIGLCPTDTLVEGEARGADRLCAEVAREMGATVEPHPAKWGEYGRAAGMIRNSEMLRSGIDLLVSFPGGRGTAHCTRTAKEMGIPVVYAIEGYAGEDGVAIEAATVGTAAVSPKDDAAAADVEDEQPDPQTSLF